MVFSLQGMTSTLTQLSPWLMEAILFLSAAFLLLLFYRFFKITGLYIWAVIATLVGNLQVLKLVQFPGFTDPVALGTPLFCLLFVVTDVLYENAGRSAAIKGIWLSFLSFAAWSLFMLLTIGYAPAPSHAATQDALVHLFLPMPSILLASLVAYAASQYTDLLIFGWLKQRYQGRFLWLRTLTSTWIGTLVDNTIFSLLAWVVLAPIPLSWETVLHTYILNTFFLRAIYATLALPVVYICKRSRVFQGAA